MWVRTPYALACAVSVRRFEMRVRIGVRASLCSNASVRSLVGVRLRVSPCIGWRVRASVCVRRVRRCVGVSVGAWVCRSVAVCRRVCVGVGALAVYRFTVHGSPYRWVSVSVCGFVGVWVRSSVCGRAPYRLVRGCVSVRRVAVSVRLSVGVYRLAYRLAYASRCAVCLSVRRFEMRVRIGVRASVCSNASVSVRLSVRQGSPCRRVGV